MALLEDVIKQIQSQITRYTDDFNDVSVIESASGDGTYMTVVLEEEITPDTYVNIRNMYSKLEAIGASGTSEGILIQFTQDHDQTYADEEKEAGVVKTVKFIGDFEGEYELVDVPTRDTIVIDSDVVPSGIYYLIEQRYGYSGRKAVSFIDNKTFKYALTQTLEPYYEEATVQSNIRVDGVGSEATIRDFIENETLVLNQKTIFVMLNDCVASRDSYIRSDARNRKEFQDDLKTEVIQTFSVYVVIPIQEQITPRVAVNYTNELRALIVKCLHGAIFDSGMVSGSQFLSTYIGDIGALDNKAYYTHRFDFEIVFNIIAEDGVAEENTTAFRTFELGVKMQFDDYENTKKTISGDIE